MAASIQAIIRKEGTEEVAKKLGFSESYMRHILSGFRSPSRKVLAKASDIYGKRLDLRASLEPKAAPPVDAGASPEESPATA